MQRGSEGVLERACLRRVCVREDVCVWGVCGGGECVCARVRCVCEGRL